MERPKIFISYAHLDAIEFAKRLAFSLEIYTDVFFDRRIRSGKFPDILRAEVKACDFFLAVMSPFASREESWCQQELECAQDHKKAIIPVRFFPEDAYNNQVLEGLYSRANFAEDFDAGFRELTQYIFEEPYSSWEYLANLPDEALIQALEKGFLPALIAREIAEWVIVEILWDFLQSEVFQKHKNHVVVANARTPRGAESLIQGILEQLAQENDAVSFNLSQKVEFLVKAYIENVRYLKDTDYQECGSIAATVIRETKEILSTEYAGRMDVREFIRRVNFYEFDIAEKIREFIISHSRKSKYLY